MNSSAHHSAFEMSLKAWNHFFSFCFFWCSGHNLGSVPTSHYWWFRGSYEGCLGLNLGRMLPAGQHLTHSWAPEMSFLLFCVCTGQNYFAPSHIIGDAHPVRACELSDVIILHHNEQVPSILIVCGFVGVFWQRGRTEHVIPLGKAELKWFIVAEDMLASLQVGLITLLYYCISSLVLNVGLRYHFEGFLCQECAS